jgi:hypothetical protein
MDTVHCVGDETDGVSLTALWVKHVQSDFAINAVKSVHIKDGMRNDIQAP